MFIRPRIDRQDWEYINRDNDNSIVANRFRNFMDLGFLEGKKLTLSFKGKEKGSFTKWKSYHETDDEQIKLAWDIHRSVCQCEIVAESDYPSYEENVAAARILGSILEKKGFTPLYWFSGNRSVHIHVFFDFKCLAQADSKLQEKVVSLLTKGFFMSKFMKFLRRKIITCWDTKVRKFDEAFINAKHLIRAELSRNGLGFKTFLGNSYTQLPEVVPVHNEVNGILPRNQTLIYSSPGKEVVNELLGEFVREEEAKAEKRGKIQRNASLQSWFNPNFDNVKGLKPCIKRILEANTMLDGTQRSAFWLCNELKKEMSSAEVVQEVVMWCNRVGADIDVKEIEYRVNKENIYKLGCNNIKSVLEDSGLGLDICQGCDRQI